MCPRARCFSARFNRLKLSAPLVEASPGHPEILGQLIDAHQGPHAFYGHALKLPGISLSSLHSCFLSRRVCPSRVCQFKGSLQASYPNDENLLILRGNQPLAIAYTTHVMDVYDHYLLRFLVQQQKQHTWTGPKKTASGIE